MIHPKLKDSATDYTELHGKTLKKLFFSLLSAYEKAGGKDLRTAA